MSIAGMTVTQVAVEYGVTVARGAFADAQRFLTSADSEVWLIGAAVLLAIYLLVKWT